MCLELRSPCGNCPFRKDALQGWLERRAEDIIKNITDRGQSFICHKTLGRDVEQHCAGAATLLYKIDQPNALMQISERLGHIDWDTHLLNKELTVDSVKEFIDIHRGDK